MNEVVARLASGRLGTRGPPQRRRQPLPELERRDPDRAPAVGRGRDRGGADPRPDRPPVGARREGRRVLGRRQDGAHAPPGRDADPPRPGVRGVRGPGRGGDPPGAGRARRAAHGPPRRDRGRDRHQRPSRVRRPGLRAPVGADRAPRPRGAEPLPRPGDARCRHRRPRRAAHDRARPVEGRLRHPADGHGPTGRAGRARPARDPARVVDHARQGEPGDRREPDDGRRPGHRQRRHDRVRPDRVAARAQRDAAGHGARDPRVGLAARRVGAQLPRPAGRGPPGDRAGPASWSSRG